MKLARQRKGKEEPAVLQGNISKCLSGGKRILKSSGGKRQKTSVGADVVSTPCEILPQQGDRYSDSALSSGTVSKMDLNLNHGDEQTPHLSTKIKLQLFPLDERTRTGLEKDGHNPFLELTLGVRKKISSVLKHLCDKWGSSSIAHGELMLFPFKLSAEDLTSCRMWTSSDIGVSAGDVHVAVGSPEVFRLRYGWVSSQPSIPTSSPLLDCSHLENVCYRTTEATSGDENRAERRNKELEACNTNEITNLAAEHRVSCESPSLVIDVNKGEAKSEDFNGRNTRERENDTLVEENMSVEPLNLQEPGLDNGVSQTPFMWADLSNISIGGLLSEASLQGRFSSQGMKSGSSRSQPTAFGADSLDAFINQLKYPHASTTLPTEMPSSILDAEDTCHSFAFPKPSAFSKPSSGKDFLTLGRSAFSGLSNQDTASRPFKCPKPEANGQKGASTGDGVQDPNTDSLSCSAGVFKNENSLGLSSIRWNDSLGPFDLPLMQRQVVKDDTVSLGGFVR